MAKDYFVAKFHKEGVGWTNHRCKTVEDALKTALLFDAFGYEVVVRTDVEGEEWNVPEFVEFARPILDPEVI